MAMALADMGGGTGCDQIMESLEQDAAVRQRKAELAFRDFCERERLPISSDPATALPSVEWRMETGDEPTWLAERGRVADLLVDGRAREPKRLRWMCSRPHSWRRVVWCSSHQPGRWRASPGLLPSPGRTGQRRPAPVAAALPFVALADRVIILSVDEGTETDRQFPERLHHALSWHNAHTTVQCLKPVGGSAIETLLATAAAAGANLLVMGGYGHSRACAR
jgi:hypothetical protein